MIDLSPCGVPVFNSLKDVKREEKEGSLKLLPIEWHRHRTNLYVQSHIFLLRGKLYIAYGSIA